ncbi:hypothetical protein C0989_010368, partial [Termitomyces sp. Mn162]
LEKEKHVAILPNPLEAKKACAEPSVFVEGSSTQRAPLMPSNDMVPASDDQRMDECPNFKAASSTARPSKLVAAYVKPLKLAVMKKETSRPSVKRAGPVQPAVMSKEADNSIVVAIMIAFSANVLQRSEAGMIKIVKSRTYVMPGVLPQEFRPPVQWDL